MWTGPYRSQAMRGSVLNSGSALSAFDIAAPVALPEPSARCTVTCGCFDVQSPGVKSTGSSDSRRVVAGSGDLLCSSKCLNWFSRRRRKMKIVIPRREEVVVVMELLWRYFGRSDSFYMCSIPFCFCVLQGP